MLMISTINRIHVQATSCLAVASSQGGSPHKPIGLELRAERFTPVPGVHKAFHRIGQKAGLPVNFPFGPREITMIGSQF